MKSHIRLSARLAALLAASAVIALPSLASAAVSVGVVITSGGGGIGCGGGDICGVASTILYLINDVLVPVLFAIAFIVFLYGVAKAYIISPASGDSEAVKEGHKYILWGIIGFVIMISLWGLVNIVANTFGLSGYTAPCLPSSTGQQPC